MCRFGFFFLTLAGLVTLPYPATAQAPRAPYGPFDAIAEGSWSNDARQLSLIGSQLDTVDYLRSITVPASVRVRRTAYYGRDPNVVAVYPYGRRGILGFRPRGYVVVRRTPAGVYDRSPVGAPPFYELDGAYGYDVRDARQPIGHESLQTGRNRWDYRPLYAGNREFDEAHREIERELAPERASFEQDAAPDNAAARQRQSTARQTIANGPEELPMPRDESREARPRSDRGAARDIARDTDQLRKNRAAVPPPPMADPPDQPVDLPGPVLRDPSNGRREF